MIPKFFFKTEIPEKIPDSFQAEVNKLKKIADKKRCLKRAYDLLSAKYQGRRTETYLKLHHLFIKDAHSLWNRSGFMHCTNMNYLLRIMLIKSGRFSDDDIELKRSLVWYISPHQYLSVRVSPDRWIDVDIWGRELGIPFGKYAHGFNT